MAFFSDLLKKWFYTNSSSAASSDARIPLLTATGEPKGSDTMDNLASVLGATLINVNVITQETTITSLASLDTQKVYYAGETAVVQRLSDWPSGIENNKEYLIFTYKLNIYGIQILFDSSCNICIRRFAGNMWQPWNYIRATV